MFQESFLNLWYLYYMGSQIENGIVDVSVLDSKKSSISVLGLCGLQSIPKFLAWAFSESCHSCVILGIIKML